MTDRAVSVTVNYVLTLVIATLLISGLLLATGDILEGQSERAIRAQLQVAGERLAAGLMTADRLARSGGASAVDVTVGLPPTAAGTTYTVTVNASDVESELTLVSEQPRETVTIPFVNGTRVANATLASGRVRIVLSGDGDLEVSNT